MKSDEELKKGDPLLYKVAKERGTETPFTGAYLNEKSHGMYHCAVCGAALFSSDTKFDSKTGWPSFTDPVFSGAVSLIEDNSHGMHRTEVVCASCKAHLGHVFSDGPEREGKVCDRYCINSVSLELKKNEV